MAESRLPVFPSRMVLTSLKDRTAAAKIGHDLLKKKSDAIKARLQRMLREILDTKRRCVVEIKDAAFKHSEAQWAAGNINHVIIENVKEATYRVKGNVHNVAGVKLPVFERQTDSVYSKDKDLQMLGLSKGGQSVAACREEFTKTLDDLVALASLQTSLRTLDRALKVSNRKVNALEFIIMPQLANTIKYVLSELDELEREDQYRIKKVKDLRLKEDEAEAEAAALLEAEAKMNALLADDDEKDGSSSTSSLSSSSSSNNKKNKGKQQQQPKSMLQTSAQLAVDTLLDADDEKTEEVSDMY